MKLLEIAIEQGVTFNRTLQFAKEASGAIYNRDAKTWTLPATARLFSPGVDRRQYRYTIVASN